MPKYTNRSLRRDILRCLNYVPLTPFRTVALLNALRPTGYDDLTTSFLEGQLNYLVDKGYVKKKMARNEILGDEIELIQITAKGIDLLEGNCSDVGVACG